MASQKTLEKKFVVEDGNVVIKETVEKVLNLEDLQREKSTYQQRQNQIIQQMEILNGQYGDMKLAIEEIDLMIASLPVLPTPTLGIKT